MVRSDAVCGGKTAGGCAGGVASNLRQWGRKAFLGKAENGLLCQLCVE